jgi:hypothetical protein
MLLLLLQCFEASTGKQFDEVSLTKDADWRPNPAAAVAYYNSLTPAVPQPGELLACPQSSPTGLLVAVQCFNTGPA